jgi:hypothetical protein
MRLLIIFVKKGCHVNVKSKCVEREGLEKSFVNVKKYFIPFKDAVGRGPLISKCTNSRGLLAL